MAKSKRASRSPARSGMAHGVRGWRVTSESTAGARRQPGTAPEDPRDDELPARQLEVGADGRLIIPAPMRRRLGIAGGGPVIARLVEGELRLVPLATAIRRAQEIVRRHVPRGVSLAEELVAERRAEAEREGREAKE